MNTYIGCKVIKAEKMSEHEFNSKYKNMDLHKENRSGYHVQYPDGYDSWSPKEVFESAYREIRDTEKRLID